MHKLLPVVLMAVLLPAGAAAQKVPPVRNAPTRMEPGVITLDQASNAAVGRVRGDLAAGKLAAWGGGQGGGIKPASVSANKALFNPTGGRDGKGVYVVAVTAAGATGHVRVLVDPKTGGVLATELSSFQWGVAPAWWQQGLSSPPPAKAR